MLRGIEALRGVDSSIISEIPSAPTQRFKPAPFSGQIII